MLSPTPADSPFPPVRDLLETLRVHLEAWMPAQRWFGAATTGSSAISVVGSAVLHQDAGALVLDAVVRAGEAPTARDYQVPLLVTRAATEPSAPDTTSADGDAAAEIAVLAVPGGPLRVADATRSEVGRRALLDLIDTGGSVAGEGLQLEGAPADRPGTAPRVLSSRLLSGEQSNSSMIYEREGAAPVIAKLFRVLQAGANPDVVIQSALDAAGSTQVAPLHGAAAIKWGGSGDAAERLQGHALFAQEFFPGVEDAWRVALRDALAGVDFSEGARTLGEATARVHQDLALRMPVTPPSDAERERLVASMVGRIDEARAEVPAVDAAGEALTALVRRAADVAWPPFQRIHGDYHLGQVLAVPERGWVLLDFEGEPMRPLAERALPDCPVRDVAGMLRSLDYAAGAVRLEHGRDADAWAQAARTAFLEGYTRIAGIRAEDQDFTVLLAAFEADKAAYEALYEARNRPAWAPIPLAALERLAG